MTNDLYAVVGNPISHSKSPRIHSLFARETGEPVEYTAIQAPRDDFAGTVKQFFERGGKGLNVTVPFKEEAWKLADRRTERAENAGICHQTVKAAEAFADHLAERLDALGVFQIHRHKDGFAAERADFIVQLFQRGLGGIQGSPGALTTTAQASASPQWLLQT